MKILDGKTRPIEPDVDEVEGRTYKQIPLAKIIPDPDQPRKTFEQAEIEQTAATMAGHGQMLPVVVYRSEALKSYVILDGERRWRAAAVAGLKSIRCEVRDRKPERVDLWLEQLIANHSVPLPPIEEAARWAEILGETGVGQ